MIRNLKALLTAVAAVLALGALTATGASAAQFHSESAPVSIKASKSSLATFTFKGGQLDCTPQEFGGTMSTKTAESLTLTPVYVVGCTITYEGFKINTTITHNGCHLKLHNNNTGSFECPLGKSMTYAGGGCTVHIQPVSGSESVTYTNNGTGIDVAIAMTNVPYTTSGFLCGSTSGTGTYAVSTHLQAGAKFWFE